jgi:hypothetical protein
MKTALRIFILPALGLLILSGFGIRQLLQVEVHEWGILVDSSATAMQSSLMVDRSDNLVRPASARCDSIFRARFPMRPIMPGWGGMDSRIPVLTFHSHLPIPMTVGVRIPGGAPTESYPIGRKEGESMSWKIRLGSPLGTRFIGAPDSLQFLVNSEVASLTASTGETSTFLFYEGRLPRQGGLEIVPVGKDSLRIVNRTGGRIHDICVERTMAGETLTACLAHLDPDQGAVQGETPLLGALAMALRTGLSEAEGRAFEKAWEGLRTQPDDRQTRWSYRLDQATADRIMPLSFSWPFVTTRRALVVVHQEAALDKDGCPEGFLPSPVMGEMLDPNDENIIDQILAGGSSRFRPGRTAKGEPRGELP